MLNNSVLMKMKHPILPELTNQNKILIFNVCYPSLPPSLLPSFLPIVLDSLGLGRKCQALYFYFHFQFFYTGLSIFKFLNHSICHKIHYLLECVLDAYKYNSENSGIRTLGFYKETE